jgi:hypothetical protein
MPVKDYSNTVIYKISCGDEEYYGHTTNFTNRKYAHKHSSVTETSKKYNLPLYQKIRSIGGWKTAEMSPVEIYPCNSAIEASIREQYWINLMNPTLNKIAAKGPSPQEYYELNKEKMDIQSKVWAKEHPDKMAQYDRKYKKNNPEKVKQTRKKYYYGHLDEVREKARLYIKNKREKMTEEEKEECRKKRRKQF